MKTEIIINGETYYYDKGATNRPKGFVWFNNHKSRFGHPREFKQILVNKEGYNEGNIIQRRLFRGNGQANK